MGRDERGRESGGEWRMEEERKRKGKRDWDELVIVSLCEHTKDSRHQFY